MLLLLGLTYVLLGYREMLMTSPFTVGAWLFYVPTWIRSALWAITGIAACWFAAIVRPHQAPVMSQTSTRRAVFLAVWRTDTFGWLGGSFLLWLIHDELLGSVPPALPLHGDPQAWTNAVLRVPFILTALICSGWKENPPRSDCR